VKRAVVLAALAVLGAGCGEGGPPGDLFVVERSGSVPGAALRLRLTNDGGAYCNDLARRELTSDQLLEARELRRALNGEKEEDEGPADRDLRLPAGRGSVFAFRVQTEDGRVEFADNSRGAPEGLADLVKLTRDVARGACGLER
jgi:hypothetical protein